MLRMTFVWALAVMLGSVMASEPSISSELSEIRTHLMRMEAMVGSAGSVGLVDTFPQEDQVNHHHHHGHKHDHGHEHQHHHMKKSRNTHVDAIADVKIAGKLGSAESLVTDLSAVDDHRAADGIGAHASPTEYEDPSEEPAGDSAESDSESDDPKDDDDSDDNDIDDDASATQQFLATKSQDTYADVDSAADAAAKTTSNADIDAAGYEDEEDLTDQQLAGETAGVQEEEAFHGEAKASREDTPADEDSGDDVPAEDYVDAFAEEEDLTDQHLIAKRAKRFAGKTAASNTQAGKDADAEDDDDEQDDGDLVFQRKPESLQADEEADGDGEKHETSNTLLDADADVHTGAHMAEQTTNKADNDAAEHLLRLLGTSETEASSIQKGEAADTYADVNSGADVAVGTSSNADDDAAGYGDEEDLTDQQILAKKSQNFASETAASNTQDEDTYADVDLGEDLVTETTTNADNAAAEYEDEDLTKGMKENRAKVLASRAAFRRQRLAKKTDHFARQTASSNTQESKDAHTYADVDSGADVASEATINADNDAAGDEDEEGSTDQQLLTKKSQHLAVEKVGEEENQAFLGKAKDSFEDAYADADSSADVTADTTTSGADNDAARDEDEEDLTDQQLLAKKSQLFAGETAASSIQEVNDADENDDDDEQDDGDLVLLRKPESLHAKDQADGDGEHHEASNTLLDADAGETVPSSTQKGEDADADGDDAEQDAHADVDAAADVMAQVISDEDNDADGDEGEALTGANAALNPIQDANGKKNDAAWYDVRRFLG